MLGAILVLTILFSSSNQYLNSSKPTAIGEKFVRYISLASFFSSSAGVASGDGKDGGHEGSGGDGGDGG